MRIYVQNSLYSLFSWFTKTPKQLPDHPLFKNEAMVGLISDYLDVPEHQKMDGFADFKSMASYKLKLKIQADRLLKCVKEADLAEMDKVFADVEKIIKEEQKINEAKQNAKESKQDAKEVCGAWTLMTHPVSHVLADGTIETTTPLKYTSKIFDKYSREKLLTYIHPSKTDDFWKHVAEQKEHIDLSLFDAYSKYEAICELVLKRKAADNKATSHLVHTLGQKQGEVAMYAGHFIKEMCRSGDEWNAQAKFDNPLPQMDCIANDSGWPDEPVVNQDLRFAKFVPKLGQEYALVRGEMKIDTENSTFVSLVRVGTYGLNRDVSAFQSVPMDHAAFRRLFEVRREQQIQELSSKMKKNEDSHAAFFSPATSEPKSDSSSTEETDIETDETVSSGMSLD